MDVTWKITDADRDEKGNIKLNSEPRSLADLLPRPSEIKQDAKRQKWTRAEMAGMTVVAFCAIAIIAYAWSVPTAPTVPPVARPTLLPTLAATSAPTVLPTTAPAALVGYFDYTDPSSAAPLTANQITRVIGLAGGWRLVDIGDAHVWLAADQVPAGVPQDSPLPNLAPRTPAPVVQPVAAPVAAPAPTRCAEVGIPGKRAQACGVDSLESLQQQAQAEWARIYGAQYSR